MLKQEKWQGLVMQSPGATVNILNFTYEPWEPF